MKLIKPFCLKKGQTIGIVAPCFFIEKEINAKKGIINLRNFGFKVKFGKTVFSKYRYTTGTIQDRAKDIMDMFTDPEIHAIICMDGGCTAIELLDKLDYNIISKNPKIFSGFSDITHLHLAFLAKSKMPTLHGLDIINGFGTNTKNKAYQFNTKLFLKCTTTNKPLGVLPSLTKWDVWRDGKAKGYLVGGWIDAILNLTNTDYFPNYNEVILFWEAMSCEPHRINMTLYALKNMGLLSKVKGMIIGKFTDCKEKEYFDCAPSLKEIVLEVTAPYKIPILANVDFGHNDQNISFPEGLFTKMDSTHKIIEITESMVRS